MDTDPPLEELERYSFKFNFNLKQLKVAWKIYNNNVSDFERLIKRISIITATPKVQNVIMDLKMIDKYDQNLINFIKRPEPSNKFNEDEITHKSYPKFLCQT